MGRRQLSHANAPNGVTLSPFLREGADLFTAEQFSVTCAERYRHQMPLRKHLTAKRPDELLVAIAPFLEQLAYGLAQTVRGGP